MNRRHRLRELIEVTRRVDVARRVAAPDWDEWAPCRCCTVPTGVPCFDDFGSTRASRIVVRTRPHPSRRPRRVGDASD